MTKFSNMIGHNQPLDNRDLKQTDLIEVFFGADVLTSLIKVPNRTAYASCF